MSDQSTSAARPLRLDLEQRRLEHRAARLERVLAALQERARVRGAEGVVPAPLRHATRDFRLELQRTRTELRRIAV